MTRVVLVVIAFVLCGCAVDEDALVCSPGSEREGASCVARQLEVDVPDIDEEVRDAGPCTTSLDCPLGYACDGSLPRPVCVIACTQPEAYPCASGFECTVAGLCISPGEGLPGASCDAANPCVANFTCSLGERPRCTQICDPRDDATCPGQTECVALESGLGLCDDPE